MANILLMLCYYCTLILLEILQVTRVCVFRLIKNRASPPNNELLLLVITYGPVGIRYAKKRYL